MYLRELIINGTSFYGEEFTLPLSPKLNCIMGGRGSGKTTILTLVNWLFAEESELPKESLALIKANLGSATLNLHLSDDSGFGYVLTKSFGSSVTIKGSDSKVVSLSELKKKVGLNYFASGTIEKIGVDPKERLRIIDEYIGAPIDVVKGKISIIESQIKQNEMELKVHTRKAMKLREELGNFESTEQDLINAKKELSASEADKGLTEKFELENAKQSQRAMEANYIAKSKVILKESLDELRKFNRNVATSLSFFNDSEKQTSAMEKIKKIGIEKYTEIHELTLKIESIMQPINSELQAVGEALKEDHIKEEAKFSELRQAIAKNRDIFQRINLLSQKETAKKISTEAIESNKASMLQLEKQRAELLASLFAAISERSSIRRGKASEINGFLDGKVRILIKDSGLNENFSEYIRTVLNKGQMRITNAELRILEVSSPTELEKYLKDKEPNKYASKLGVDKERIGLLFKVIIDNDLVYDLEVCICEDSPNFFLAVEDSGGAESLKPTEELSTGQRCTAILPIIFAVTKNPLLIDQPEDNLDNRYIAKSIHQIIRGVKDKRQLIFVTHNPNIPVISDSEYCAFLSYSDKHSEIIASGHVDEVKTQIVDLLEGGTAAFMKRKEFYGY